MNSGSSLRLAHPFQKEWSCKRGEFSDASFTQCFPVLVGKGRRKQESPQPSLEEESFHIKIPLIFYNSSGSKETGPATEGSWFRFQGGQVFLCLFFQAGQLGCSSLGVLGTKSVPDGDVSSGKSQKLKPQDDVIMASGEPSSGPSAACTGAVGSAESPFPQLQCGVTPSVLPPPGVARG